MQNQPSPYDAVYGGQPVFPHDGVVLGGLEGVRQQLNVPYEAVRVAALHKALDYGEAGLDQVIESLRDNAQGLRQAAYFMLLHRPEAKVQAALTQHGLLHHYEVVTVGPQGQILQREPKQTHLFRESLGNVSLDMVPIPGGTFLMGSPENELYHLDDESPQHEVAVPPFFMGRFPITQAQWRFVAQLEPTNRELDADQADIDGEDVGTFQLEPTVRELDTDPSNFKGDNRPVERVSWYDATEFCARLSQLTGRDYRLPSEAEWEYACRAGTTTPFHCGETITSDLANYHGYYTYGQGPKGIYRRETTEVGSFPPNAFGLHDMHGNVWEWCQDHWHSNYDDAPTDGRAWIEVEDSEQRIHRGGSWADDPRNCRSAFRFDDAPDVIDYSLGFRVACSAPRAFL